MTVLLVYMTITGQVHFTPEERELFSIRTAKPILRTEEMPPHASRVARKMIGNARRAARAFVSEDGTAVAVQVGTIDKIDIENGTLLADADRYMVRVEGNRITAYNASQAAYLDRAIPSATGMSLFPLVLLDRHRTLCANGVASAQPTTPPSNHLFLAVIDERERGKSPNVASRTVMPEEVAGAYRMSVVSIDGAWYTLSIGSSTYLQVNVDTLQTRSVRKPPPSEFQPSGDRASLSREYPGVRHSIRALVRWNDGAYVVAAGFPGGSKSLLVKEDEVTDLDPWAVVAASANGKYAWLINRQTGESWLIGR